jgi:gliding motility-associated-like protein
MPDAFRPGGKNSRFRPKPQPLFVDPQSFKMTILSRWGLQIFETTDMANGWDGLVKGQYAPSGLYAYILNYKSLTGKDYTKRGTVMLVR